MKAKGKTLTSRERFARMYAHQEADRVPIVDGPWSATIERWRREGMPADADYVDFFGLDRCAHIGVGYRGDKEVIRLVHPQQIHPHLENQDTGDYINIFGKPEVHMAIKPEIAGGIATMGITVNMIPHIVAATPGGWAAGSTAAAAGAGSAAGSLTLEASTGTAATGSAGASGSGPGAARGADWGAGEAAAASGLDATAAGSSGPGGTRR